jgi:hypothetical protein
MLTAHPGEAMASPETLEALEECRARIELLSHVNETSLRKLSKKQLVGVVGDLLAMAARQEFERARRFETATSSASVRRAKEKAEREAALRRERERAEQAERAAIRERRVAAAVTIQKRFRGNAVRAKSWHRRQALASYEKDLREAEARAAEAMKREAACVTIQSAFRARVARREANKRWLQAWASRRRDASRRQSGADEAVTFSRSSKFESESESESASGKKATGGSPKRAPHSGESVYRPRLPVAQTSPSPYVFFADEAGPSTDPPESTPPQRARAPPPFRLDDSESDEA